MGHLANVDMLTLVKSRKVWELGPMEKTEHAIQLRRALAQAQLSNGDVALALGVSGRTIVNWTSKTNPTMPSEKDQERLRRLLPGYDNAGDPVEVALSKTELAPHRRTEVLLAYQRALHDQMLEDQRLAQG